MQCLLKKIGVVITAFLLSAGAGLAFAKSTNGTNNAGNSGGSIFITGSDTVEPLVKRLVTEFKARYPQYKNWNISISASNTANGIEDLLAGNSTIAMSSRDLRDSEIAAAQKKGAKIVPITIAHDGVAVIVNAKNPVSNLTMQQLSDIFSGNIKSWKDLGWEDDIPVKILTREQGSGSAAFFNELVLHIPKNSSIDVRPVGDNIGGYGALVDTIDEAANAIGYVSYGYLQARKQAEARSNQDYAGEDKEKILKLDGVELTPATVVNEAYKLTRPLYLYIDAKLSDKAVERRLIDFIVSRDGQKIVESLGFDAAAERPSRIIKQVISGEVK